MLNVIVYATFTEPLRIDCNVARAQTEPTGGFMRLVLHSGSDDTGGQSAAYAQIRKRASVVAVAIPRRI